MPLTKTPSNMLTHDATATYPAGTVGASLSRIQVSVEDYPFLAKFDGVTDDSPAIQSAINWLASVGGGDLICPGRTAKLLTGLVNNSSGVYLIGKGAGNYKSGVVQPTKFIYAGSAGATVVAFGPPSGSTVHKVHDMGFVGIAIDGGGLAARGLVVSSVQSGSWYTTVNGCTDTQIVFNVVALSADSKNSQANTATILRATATGNQNGILLTTETGLIGGNISFNEFKFIDFVHENGYGLKIGNTDNNTFTQIRGARTTGGTGIGVILGAGDGTTVNNARANVIERCSPGDGGILSEGTEVNTVPATDNRILYLDKENAAADPVIGTGSKLLWGTSSRATGSMGLFKAGIGTSLAAALNAIDDANATAVALSIASATGSHFRLHNMGGGKWVFGVDAADGNLSIVKGGTNGDYIDLTAAAPIAPITYTWAGKPAATLFPVGTKIHITDVGGPAGSDFTSNGTRWYTAQSVVTSSAVPATVPVTTAETVLATISIPNDILGPNGFIEVLCNWAVTNNANAKTGRVRYDGVAGTATSTAGMASQATNRALVHIQNRGATNSQLFGVVSGAGAAGWGNSTGTFQVGTVDTTATTTVVITGQLAVDTDTLRLDSYAVRITSG